jgi:hypothetical protein
MMRRHIAPHAMLTDMGGEDLKAASRCFHGCRGRAVVGTSKKCPVSRANGWPGCSKPRGVSRMAQTQGHYRSSPPLLQEADNDLHSLSARKG